MKNETANGNIQEGTNKPNQSDSTQNQRKEVFGSGTILHSIGRVLFWAAVVAVVVGLGCLIATIVDGSNQHSSIVYVVFGVLILFYVHYVLPKS